LYLQIQDTTYKIRVHEPELMTKFSFHLQIKIFSQLQAAAACNVFVFVFIFLAAFPFYICA